MSLFICGCPYGCRRTAEDVEICQSCRLGYHGRTCETPVARAADSKLAECCGPCGAHKDEHAEGLAAMRRRYPNVVERITPPEPHRELGVLLPFPLDYYSPGVGTLRDNARSL